VRQGGSEPDGKAGSQLGRAPLREHPRDAQIERSPSCRPLMSVASSMWVRLAIISAVLGESFLTSASTPGAIGASEVATSGWWAIVDAIVLRSGRSGRCSVDDDVTSRGCERIGPVSVRLRAGVAVRGKGRGMAGGGAKRIGLKIGRAGAGGS